MKNRNGTIDFLKFVFIVIIFLFHGSKNLTSKVIFSCASILVEFFFLVSGYFMAANAAKKTSNEVSVGYKTTGYLLSKISKISPNYYIAWVIAFIVTEASKKMTVKKLFTDLFMSIPELTFVSSSGILGTRFNSAAWYISAMLLAMLVLYPLCYKLKDTFNGVIAPIISIGIYAYMYQNYNYGISSPATWVGYMTKGLLRGFAGIALGCFCYHIVTIIKQKEFKSTLFKIALTIAEWAVYGLILYSTKGYDNRKYDFILIIVLAVGVTISFTDLSYSSKLFNNKFVYWLGEFSFNLFISHGFWSHVLKKLLKGASYGKTMLVYSAISFVTALYVMYFSKFINVLFGKKKSKKQAEEF